jgi:hypothetical protein
MWSAGKPLPAPFSRAVVRAAFGGVLRSDGFEDRVVVEWIAGRARALEALRVGVAAAGVVLVRITTRAESAVG